MERGQRWSGSFQEGVSSLLTRVLVVPWQAGNKFAEQSPVSYVASVKTPLLLLHATNDIRTPIDQTLQEYSALKILGRSVTYVEFPRENHDLSRTGEPIHRVERLHILSDWMDRYLKR